MKQYIGIVIILLGLGWLLISNSIQNKELVELDIQISQNYSVKVCELYKEANEAEVVKVKSNCIESYDQEIVNAFILEKANQVNGSNYVNELSVSEDYAHDYLIEVSDQDVYYRYLFSRVGDTFHTRVEYGYVGDEDQVVYAVVDDSDQLKEIYKYLVSIF
jgi:hypothetical protein